LTYAPVWHTDDNIDLPAHNGNVFKIFCQFACPSPNTIFLSFALAYAETIAAERVLHCAGLDYSGYTQIAALTISRAMQEVSQIREQDRA